MQIFVKQRETLEGAIEIQTPAIDVSNSSLLVSTLIVYNISGSSPGLTVTLQSCDDLESWEDNGSTEPTLGAAGQDVQPADVVANPYGRYVRYKIAFTGSSSPNVQYSLILNTHESS